MDRHGLISTLFGVPRPLIGMLHVEALPGSPQARRSIDAIIAQAVADATVYREGGFHGLLVENMHDRPYLRSDVGPETVAAMAVIGHEVRRVVPLPLGVQVLAAANHAALAVAVACGAAFVRAEGFVFAHVADEGLIEADAGPLLRHRTRINAGHVRLFADIKKKHSAHAMTADVDLAETARAAEFFLADGVIVTGAATGREAAKADVDAVAAAVGIPTLVGSGLDADNLSRFASADGFIVGSAAKHDGHWTQPPDPRRVRALAEARAALMAP
jgi:membrane complex biogenesis BtpA family protein